MDPLEDQYKKWAEILARVMLIIYFVFIFIKFVLL